MVFSSEFSLSAVTFWEKKTRSRLTPEDANQIIRNLAGFFQILHEWQEKDQDPVQVVKGKYGTTE